MNYPKQLPFFILFGFLILLIYYSFSIRNNILVQTTFTYSYLFLFLVIIGLAVYLSQRFSQGPFESISFQALFYFIGVLFVVLLFMYYHNVYQIFSQSFFSYLIIFAIIVVALTILYNIIKNTSVPVDSNFILQFIFFIPCLITDFIKYLGNEYTTTPNIVFVLFLLEIAFIIFYFYFMSWIENYSKNDRIAILDNSVFLDKQMILSTNNAFLIDAPQNSFFNNTPITTINKNYSISMWVYISSPEKRNETEIFNYGGHPRLTYYNNTDNTQLKQDKLIVYFSSDDKTEYHFSVPQQKWNFIVITYNGNGICDLFLNAELIKSMDYKATYSASDSISIGSDDGIYGSISNISYYRNPLSLRKIRTTYQLLMLKNPPVFDKNKLKI